MSWFLVIKRDSLGVIVAKKAKKIMKYLLRYFRSNFEVGRNPSDHITYGLV